MNTKYLNNRGFILFYIIILASISLLLSACGTANSGLSGGGGLADTPTDVATEIATEPPATETPVPTETPIPEPTLGVGSTQVADDGMTQVYVPAGEFKMGADADKALADCQSYTTECDPASFTDEAPIHSVSVDAFWIDQTEVTNAMYSKCVAAGGCKASEFKGSVSRNDYYGVPQFDDYPVVFMDWDMVNAYCSWAGRRLPTEAEWEKAARGTDERQFPWGSDLSCNQANFYDFYNSGQYCTGDTTKVGSYESGKSPYGAYDMAGNVMEWVSDFYAGDYYQYSPASNPAGPAASRYNILRGGSWYSYPHEIRATERLGVPPFFTNHYVGFRCASSAQ